MESKELGLEVLPRENRKIPVLGICLLMCLSAQGGDLTRWIGAGTDSLWTNPTNWDAGAVPGYNSDVLISNTGTNHVVLNVDTTVASVTVGGAQTAAVLDLMGVNLSVNESSIIGTNGTIEVISNSSFAGFGSLQNSGTIRVPAGLGTVSFALNCDFTNYGIIDAETNSELDLPGSNTAQFTLSDGTTFAGPGTTRFVPGDGSLSCDGVITMNGIVEFQRQQSLIVGPATWTGAGLFRWQGGAMAFINFATDFHVEISGQENMGSCTNNGSIRALGDGSLGVEGTIYNNGLFQIETNYSIEGLAFSSGIENRGTIKIPDGLGAQTLSLNCDFANYGIIDVETNSELDLPGFNTAQFSLMDGTTFAGPGTIRFVSDEGSITCDGVITVNGTMEFQRDHGGLFGQSILTGPGLFRWQGGVMAFINFASDFHVEISGQENIEGDCTNNGSIRVLGNSTLGVFGGTFYNNGLFQVETNYSIEGLAFSSSFENRGTIKIPDGLGAQTLSLNCDFANYGIIDVETNSELDLPGFNTAQFSLMDGTTFAGPGTIRFVSDEGTIACDGVITVNGTMEFQRDSGGLFGPSILTGPGLFRWQGGAMAFINFAPGFHVEMSGQESVFGDCTNQGSIRLIGNTDLAVSSATLYNSGLFQLETNCYLQGYGGQFQNSGTIKVPAGLGTQTLTLNGCNFTNCGTLCVETNSVLNLTDTNYTYSDVPMLFGDGTIFDGPGTLRLVPQSGAIGCMGTMKVNDTVEYKSQGLMIGPSKWTGPGLLRWLNGGIKSFTFAPDFHAEISGPDWKYLSLYCTNQGSIRWLGGGNLAGGGDSPEILYNEGLLQVEASGLWWDFPLHNQPSGTFHQVSGELMVDSFDNRGTVLLESGKLTVQGNFSSTNYSAYQVVLSGNAPSTNFNQLNAKNLALGGALQVILTNGFYPADGSTFAIAQDQSQSGRFDSITVPPLQSNLTWHVQYAPDSVVLGVVQPPAMGGSGSTNGQFQFSFSTYAGVTYEIQVSTNLVDWTTVQTNSYSSGSATFIDTNAANFSQRYYRCLILE